MAAPILVAGIDSRSLFLEAPVLLRDRAVLEEKASGRALLDGLARENGRLVILGTHLPDLDLLETLHRIRSLPATRRVSILVLVPADEREELEEDLKTAGANAALRRPLDRAQLEGWIAKLLAVPRRVDARVPVFGQVVGTPRTEETGHFYGLSRNLSVNGMLLASPVRLTDGPDLDLELQLPDKGGRVRALGRVVRDAGEVGWPYLGYGVEFLFVPPESQLAIELTVASAVVSLTHLTREGAPAGIHATVRSGTWIYEIVEPVAYEAGYLVEIRRGPREGWRPGVAGPFYVVEGRSPEVALRAAREFVHAQA
jgi:CheY-like chemotaxis protein